MTKSLRLFFLPREFRKKSLAKPQSIEDSQSTRRQPPRKAAAPPKRGEGIDYAPTLSSRQPSAHTAGKIAPETLCPLPPTMHADHASRGKMAGVFGVPGLAAAITFASLSPHRCRERSVKSLLPGLRLLMHGTSRSQI